VKRVILLSDLHAGHITGLTPPGWMFREERYPKLYAMQKEMWAKYRALIRKLGPVDVLIANGDLIDGKGKRSGGTELVTTDLLEQGDMAVKALQIWNADSTFVLYGTPYHVTADSGEDVEKIIGEKLEAQVHSHAFIDVEGVVFDCKHKIGSSQIPWSKHTAISRERIHNFLWNAAEEGQPKANVFIRSHVHYFNYCGGIDWLAMTLPALQGPHTKFGARQCSGVVDWGLVVMDVDKGKIVNWKPEIIRLENFKQELIKV